MDPFQTFLQYVNQKEPLTSEQINEKLVQYSQMKEGEEKNELRNEIIEDNLRLVISIASGYSKVSSANIMDLIQEGNRGLSYAVEKFQVERGLSFSTYAYSCIQNYIRLFLQKHSHLISIPSHTQVELKEIKEVQKDFLERYNREPSIEEIYKELGGKISEDKITKLLLFGKDVISLDEERESKEDSFSLLDTLTDNSDPSLYFSNKEKEELIREALSSLTQQERDVIISRYGLEGKEVSLSVLADKYHVSAQRIQQIEKNALDKMKSFLRLKM